MAIIVGTPGDDVQFGTSEPDDINGGAGNDRISGGCYDDLIVGGSGADTLDGGHGKDVIYDGAYAADTGAFTPDSDADQLLGGVGRDELYGGVGDNLDGGADDDSATLTFTATSNVYLDFRGLNNGGTANFSLGLGDFGTVRAVESLSVFTGSGADTVIAHDAIRNTLTLAFNENVIETGAGDDIVVGGAGVDLVRLGDGADYAAGGAGDDTLDALVNGGDDGDVDQLFGGEGSDRLIGSNTDLFDGGDDFGDSARVVFSTATGVFVDLRGYNPNVRYYFEGGGSIIGVEQLRIDGGEGADTILGTARGSASGNGGDDVIVMGANENHAAGGAGADYIDGGDGGDVLFSGLFEQPEPGSIIVDDLGARAEDGAVDRLIGGLGSDLLILGVGDFGDGGSGAFTTDTAILNLSALTQDVYLDFTNIATSAYFALPGGGGVSGIEGVGLFSGSGNDVVISNELQTRVDGGAGDDALIGRDNRDELSGGAGDDYLNGGGFDDQLMGGTGADELRGGGGNDGLFAADDSPGSKDIIVGEGGDDFVSMNYTDFADGGAGFDMLSLSFAGLDRGAYFDFAVAAGGNAVDLASFGGTGSFVGFETFRAIGGDFADTFFAGRSGFGQLSGGGGDDILIGRDDADLLFGDAGADYLDGGDSFDQLFGGEGSDTIRGGADDDFIIAGVSDASAEPDDDIVLGEDGNDRITSGDGFDYLDGGAGNDDLNGDGSNDVLIGGEGNDELRGGCGDDRLTGGAGEDVFVFVGTTTGEYDTITDYNRADDGLWIDPETFPQSGLKFTSVQEGDYNGDGVADTLLGYASGNVLVLSLTGLTLADWNGELVV